MVLLRNPFIKLCWAKKEEITRYDMDTTDATDERERKADPDQEQPLDLRKFHKGFFIE